MTVSDPEGEEHSLFMRDALAAEWEGCATSVSSIARDSD